MHSAFRRWTRIGQNIQNGNPVSLKAANQVELTAPDRSLGYQDNSVLCLVFQGQECRANTSLCTAYCLYRMDLANEWLNLFFYFFIPCFGTRDLPQHKR